MPEKMRWPTATFWLALRRPQGQRPPFMEYPEGSRSKTGKKLPRPLIKRANDGGC